MWKLVETVFTCSSNAMWVREEIEPATGFQETIEEACREAFTSLGFGDPSAAGWSNRWVAEQTDDHIQELLSSELSALVVTVVTNAVVFNEVWSLAFDEEQTLDVSFTLLDGVAREHP